MQRLDSRDRLEDLDQTKPGSLWKRWSGIKMLCLPVDWKCILQFSMYWGTNSHQCLSEVGSLRNQGWAELLHLPVTVKFVNHGLVSWPTASRNQLAHNHLCSIACYRTTLEATMKMWPVAGPMHADKTSLLVAASSGCLMHHAQESRHRDTVRTRVVDSWEPPSLRQVREKCCVFTKNSIRSF